MPAKGGSSRKKADGTAMKLYAFSMTGATISPRKQPVILKCGGQQQHQQQPSSSSMPPCEQWKPFAEEYLQIATDKAGTAGQTEVGTTEASTAVYILDTTGLGPKAHEAEMTLANPSLGQVLQPAERALSRLNPVDGKLIAAGKTYLFALKLLLFGDLGVEGRLSQLMLFLPPCPAGGSDDPLEKLLNLAKKKRQTPSSSPTTAIPLAGRTLTIIVAEQAEVTIWQNLGEVLGEYFEEIVIHRLSKKQNDSDVKFQKLADICLGIKQSDRKKSTSAAPLHELDDKKGQRPSALLRLERILFSQKTKTSNNNNKNSTSTPKSVVGQDLQYSIEPVIPEVESDRESGSSGFEDVDDEDNDDDATSTNKSQGTSKAGFDRRQAPRHSRGTSPTGSVSNTFPMQPPPAQVLNSPAASSDPQGTGGSVTTGSLPSASSVSQLLNLEDVYPAEFNDILGVGGFQGTTTVRLEGIVLGSDKIGNAHGTFTICCFANKEEESRFPKSKQGVQLTGVLSRNATGCLTLSHVQGVKRVSTRPPSGKTGSPSSRSPREPSANNEQVDIGNRQSTMRKLLVPLNQIAPLDHTAISRAYGCILIRGSKCLVTRGLQGSRKTFDGMRLPWALHTETHQSTLECAISAVCDHCSPEITPDKFYIQSLISPAVCYLPAAKKDAPPIVLTLYVAVAVANPPAGVASDRVEDEEGTESENFDWMSYRQACANLGQPEQRALEHVVNNLKNAYEAGVYKPLPGLGLFGSQLRLADERIGNCFFLVSPTSSLKQFNGVQDAFIDALVSGETSTCFSANQIHRLDGATFCPSRHHDRVVDAMFIEVQAALKREDKCVNFVVALSPDADLFSLEHEIMPQLEKKLSLRCIVAVAVLGKATYDHYLVPCNSEPISVLDPHLADDVNLQKQMTDALRLADLVIVPSAALDGGSVEERKKAELHAAIQAINRKALLQDVFMSAADQVMALTMKRKQNKHESKVRGPGVDTPSPPSDVNVAVTSVLSYTYVNSSAPMHPSSFADFLEKGIDHLKLAQVISLSGKIWVATRGTRKGKLTLIGETLNLDGGEAWEEGEQRKTEITFVCLTSSVPTTSGEQMDVRQVVEGAMSTLLISNELLKKGPKSWCPRHIEDPLPEWVEDTCCALGTCGEEDDGVQIPHERVGEDLGGDDEDWEDEEDEKSTYHE